MVQDVFELQVNIPTVCTGNPISTDTLISET